MKKRGYICITLHTYTLTLTLTARYILVSPLKDENTEAQCDGESHQVEQLGKWSFTSNPNISVRASAAITRLLFKAEILEQ